jgi:hypothetical protein
MIIIIDVKDNTHIRIPNLEYLPRKGDIVEYEDDNTAISGVVISVIHSIYKSTNDILYKPIIIKVY